MALNTSTSNDISTATKANYSYYKNFKLQGLSPETRYYIWAYAVNAAGEYLSSPVVIDTPKLFMQTVPGIGIGKIQNIGKSSVEIFVDAYTDGGSAISEFGVCYDTSPNPTSASSKK